MKLKVGTGEITLTPHHIKNGTLDFGMHNAQDLALRHLAMVKVADYFCADTAYKYYGVSAKGKIRVQSQASLLPKYVINPKDHKAKLKAKENALAQKLGLADAAALRKAIRAATVDMGVKVPFHIPMRLYGPRYSHAIWVIINYAHFVYKLQPHSYDNYYVSIPIEVTFGFAPTFDCKKMKKVGMKGVITDRSATAIVLPKSTEGGELTKDALERLLKERDAEVTESERDLREYHEILEDPQPKLGFTAEDIRKMMRDAIRDTRKRLKKERNQRDRTKEALAELNARLSEQD